MAGALRTIRIGLALLLLAGSGRALVLHSRDEALALAFPDATEIQPLDFYLTPEQRSEIEHLARAKLDSNLITVYAGYKDGQATGYALLDTHVVRTLPETLLIVLSPQGEVRATHLLAFYEPPEYAPPEAWLKKFAGKTLKRETEAGRTVDAIAGSTLTARAAANAVTRALAVYAVLLAERK
ncbi:MAG: hypothetical protein KatS3mg077_0980 [Candidatus Binatia bacterium]|nr:MAG: hypothetical protein KatS3mg077_0980 [Candidatus Binatia bacterium]